MVEKRLGKVRPFKMTADQGEIIFVDTTNCLHYGSRNSIKPKYHLTIQFYQSIPINCNNL